MRARARFAMPTLFTSLAVHSDVSGGRYAMPRFFIVTFFGSAIKAADLACAPQEKNATLRMPLCPLPHFPRPSEVSMCIFNPCTNCSQKDRCCAGRANPPFCALP